MLAAPSQRSSASGRKRPAAGNLGKDCSAGAGVAVDTSQRNQHGRCVPGRHLFVCTNDRSAGKPACGPRGGTALVAAVEHELLVRRVSDVLVTPCGCLGPCFDGPNAVIYPDGAWYAGLEAGDAVGLAEHLITGAPLAAKVASRPGDSETP